jgi:excisionase family DNA binding protein
MTDRKPRTVREAAQELGLSVHTIRAWIARRKISSIRLGRAVRISPSEIARLLDQGTIPAIEDRRHS